MANATPSRLGQQNLTGANDALFVKVFSGEVMSTFNAKTVMAGRTRTRNISEGKSASFAAIGKTVAEYHTAGEEITGNKIKHDEKIITIDDLLISHTFISQIDQAKNHYEVRSEYSLQMGQALAQTYDRNLLSMGVKAARDPSGLGLGVADQGSSESVALGSATPSTAQIVDGFYAAAQKFDEKNIPESDRFALVSPAVFYALVKDDKLLNRDFGGNNGAYVDANILRVAGIEIVKTNNLSVDHTADTLDFASKYSVDATDCSALIMNKSAMGTVKLMDVATEMEWDIRRQGTLAVCKMAVGHGILRPEGIIELRAAV